MAEKSRFEESGAENNNRREARNGSGGPLESVKAEYISLIMRGAGEPRETKLKGINATSISKWRQMAINLKLTATSARHVA